jgi:ABC-type Fe3+-hydroxamate transport system substrate-binding protein
MGDDKKKMKKKTLVLIGIAVCAILLTSPVLASGGYSKIYGNANEDDVLDMRDVTYIKLVIFGKKPATTFADANYDGKISMLDIGQTKLIILSKEGKLTLIDQADRTVTVPRPIERVVSVNRDAERLVVALGGCDRLVGVQISDPKVVKKYLKGEYFLGLFKACKGRLLEVPYTDRENMELIVSLKPDVVVVAAYSSDYAVLIQEKTGIPVVCLRSTGHELDHVCRAIELMGVVLDELEEAEDLVSFVNEEIDKVSKVTSQIPDSDKPTVYFSNRGVLASKRGGFMCTLTRYDPIDIAGGINVAKDCTPTTAGDTPVVVSKEQIIAWNPDIIIVAEASHTYGAPSNDVELILSDPDLQTVDAVKNHRVYFSLYPHARGRPQPRNLANMMYLAKLFHPEEFEDLDVEEEGNEIYERFLRVDDCFSEYADWLGWMREWLASQK